MEEGIHDVCLADRDNDRHDNLLQNRPYRPYTFSDMMWIPMEVVKYLREVSWPMARCPEGRDPDVEQGGAFPYFED
eukprot:11195810-Lingulodinium_polyedra.AAC.1